jgi:hypothetical protein
MGPQTALIARFWENLFPPQDAVPDDSQNHWIVVL